MSFGSCVSNVSRGHTEITHPTNSWAASYVDHTCLGWQPLQPSCHRFVLGYPNIIRQFVHTPPLVLRYMAGNLPSKKRIVLWLFNAGCLINHHHPVFNGNYHD